MENFIHNLFENENFPTYLISFIIVLLIAFLIVFFWGKKDHKKLIATQKLKKLEDEQNDIEKNYEKDAFKIVDDNIETLDIELPKLNDSLLKEEVKNNYEYTRTIEMPKLNKEVDINNFSKLADSIEEELDSLESYNNKNSNSYDETIELPKLKN